MIYSPNVVFIRGEDYAFLPVPVIADILTSPAVNLGSAMRQGEDEEACYQVMEQRMRKILSVFADRGNRDVILGAFGCGVFHNDPIRIKEIWKKLLMEEQWQFCFDSILFAVYDNSRAKQTIEAFQSLVKV